MLAVLAFLSFYSFSSSSRIVGVYEEIYPAISNLSLLQSIQDCDPETSSSGTCPLFFGLLSSFGGIYRSSGCIPGVKMALDEINRDPSLLPGYSLHYTLKDSQVCFFQVCFIQYIYKKNLDYHHQIYKDLVHCTTAIVVPPPPLFFVSKLSLFASLY